MKRLFLVPALLIAAFVVVTAAPPKNGAGYNLTGWRKLEMSANRITASGGAPLITSGDGKLRLGASRIILTTAREGKGRETISSAEAVGSVKLHAVPSPGQQIDAVCSRAVIRPSAQRADLSGNVVVKRWDRAKFAGPIELTGDSVTLFFREGRVVAHSSESRSRFSASPKAEKR